MDKKQTNKKTETGRISSFLIKVDHLAPKPKPFL